MMGRQPVELELLGLKVTCQPLKFPEAQAILPEVMHLVSLVLKEVGTVLTEGGLNIREDDVVKLLPALTPLTAHFRDGLLERLAPKILAATSVVMKDLRGEPSRYDLMKESDRNAVFDEHPEVYLPLLFVAGRVTFGRFFPAGALRELLARRKAGSTPTGSSPST